MLGLVATAWAAVIVEPTETGCALDQSMLEEDLRLAVGDKAVDELAFGLALSGQDPWTLKLTVADKGRTLWDRSIEVQPADCPYLPALAVQSFQAGLATVPGWGLPPPERVGNELGVVMFASAPFGLRFGLGGDLVLGIARAFRWQVDLGVAYSTLQQIRPFGALQLAEVVPETGPVLQIRVGDRAIRWSNRLGAGVGVAVGSALERSHTAPFGRGTYISELAWLPTSMLRLGARVSLMLPPVSIQIEDGGNDRLYAQEPFLRVGLSLEVARSLRRGDVGGTLRP